MVFFRTIYIGTYKEDNPYDGLKSVDLVKFFVNNNLVGFYRGNLQC